MNPEKRLSEKELLIEPYQITAGVKAYVFCLVCRVNIKKDRIHDHTGSAKDKKNKATYQSPWKVEKSDWEYLKVWTQGPYLAHQVVM